MREQGVGTQRQSLPQYAGRTLVICLLALSVGLSLFLVAHSRIGHDQAWYLYAADQTLHGVTLYGPHLTETNPPLIIWFSLLPDLLARTLPISLPQALFLCVMALAAGSAAWCARLLRQVTPTMPHTQQLVLALLVYLVECSVSVGEFGQREQLAVILMVPYLVGFGLPRTRELSRLEAALLGSAAALGACFKPQQVITLAAVQLGIYLLRYQTRRLRSPETFAAGITYVTYGLYLTAIGVFARLYFTGALPLLVKTYWAFCPDAISVLLAGYWRLNVLFVLAIALFVAGRRWFGLSMLPGLFLVACAGAHLAYAVQRAARFYQFIPRTVFLDLALLWMLVEFATFMLPLVLARRAWFDLKAAAFALVILICVERGPVETARTQKFNGVPQTASATFLASLPAGTPIYVLSTNLSAAFPAVLLDHLVWSSRFAHLWMLPALQLNEDMRRGGPKAAKVLTQDDEAQLAALLRSNVAQDLQYWRPAYVLTPHCATTVDCLAVTDPRFDILAWFKQSAAFDAAWGGYRYKQTFFNKSGEAEWDVYVRK